MLETDESQDTVPQQVETPSPQRVFGVPLVLPSTFRALRHRNFQLFWSGQMISLIGTWMQNMAQQWLVPLVATQQFGKDQASLYAGLVGALGSAPMLVFILYGGVVADRYDKRRILILTQSCAMLVAFGLGMLVRSGHIHLWQLALFAILAGTVHSFDMPTRQSYIKEMVGPQDLCNAIALNSTVFNSARIIGPAVAGWLIALPHVGMQGAYFLNAASFLAVIAGLFAIRTPRLAPAAMSGNIRQHIAEGFRYVRQQPVIRLLMIMIGMYSIFALSYMVLVPIIVLQILGKTIKEFGLLMAFSGVGAFVGAILLATISGRVRKGMVLLVGGILFPVGLLAFSFSRSIPLSAALLTMVGGGFVVSNATINSMIQEIAPDHLRGRVVSIWALLFAGFTPLGQLYEGVVAHFTTPPIALAAGAMICLMMVALISMKSPWLWRVE